MTLTNVFAKPDLVI